MCCGGEDPKPTAVLDDDGGRVAGVAFTISTGHKLLFFGQSRRGVINFICQRIFAWFMALHETRVSSWWRMTVFNSLEQVHQTI